MLDITALEALFLEQPQLTDEQNVAKTYTASSLADHPFLKELFVTTYKVRIIDVLSFVNDREFEKAYAALQVIASLQEMQSVFTDAKAQVEQEKQQSSSEQQGIKY